MSDRDSTGRADGSCRVLQLSERAPRHLLKSLCKKGGGGGGEGVQIACKIVYVINGRPL